MKHSQNLFTLLCSTVAIFLLFPQDASAYIDPGTGSMIFQLIAAGLFMASLAIKVFWGKIKAFFSALFLKKSRVENENE
jgi:hypothetical protein